MPSLPKYALNALAKIQNVNSTGKLTRPMVASINMYHITDISKTTKAPLIAVALGRELTKEASEKSMKEAKAKSVNTIGAMHKV